MTDLLEDKTELALTQDDKPITKFSGYTILHAAISYVTKNNTAVEWKAALAEATKEMQKAYNELVAKQFYVRGMQGPAFRISHVDSDNVTLKALTSITGHLITANTKDIPNGWDGPISEEELNERNTKQDQLAKKFQESEQALCKATSKILPDKPVKKTGKHSRKG